MIKLRISLLALLGFFVFACNDNDNIPTGSGNSGGGLSGNNGVWAIPQDEIFDGGPGKDGIPALESPQLIPGSSATYLRDDELIIGFKSGNDIRAYPHQILDWHEIVNDEVNTAKIAITYCPLTGTGIGWNRNINNATTTFGVSGLLYNTNLIPYDRLTNSNWSQMRLDCVHGELKGTQTDIFQVVETTWGTWKEFFPETKVLSRNTGHSRTYGVYPYGSYKTNNEFFLFPVSPKDTRIPAKDRVLGVIINGNAKIYQFGSFPSDGVGLVEDNFNGENLMIVGSDNKNIIVAFYTRTIDGDPVTGLSPISKDSEVILLDEEGNRWNIFGESLEGPKLGKRLSQPVSYIGFFFAWGAFYPGVEIFQD